jgi:hypothetical protein
MQRGAWHDYLSRSRDSATAARDETAGNAQDFAGRYRRDASILGPVYTRRMQKQTTIRGSDLVPTSVHDAELRKTASTLGGLQAYLGRDR